MTQYGSHTSPGPPLGHGSHAYPSGSWVSCISLWVMGLMHIPLGHGSHAYPSGSWVPSRSWVPSTGSWVSCISLCMCHGFPLGHGSHVYSSGSCVPCGSWVSCISGSWLIHSMAFRYLSHSSVKSPSSCLNIWDAVV